VLAKEQAVYSSPQSLSLPELDPRVVVRPDWVERCRVRGLTTPEAFLEIPGEIISGHPDRHVMRVILADGSVAYLKREHRIRWRDRFRNWRAGFGWVSKSVREGRILQQLDQLGLHAPKWLAFGEDSAGRAFLLVEEAAGTDLRRLQLNDADADELAAHLGRFCAELHESSVDHPDLYAKHFLIDPANLNLVILDWQRATVGKEVTWPARIRALAALAATVSESLTTPRRRARFLWAYRRVIRAARQTGSPSFANLAQQVQAEVKQLERRRGIREQKQPPLPKSAQWLVWLNGEVLCSVPDVSHLLDSPWMHLALYDQTRDGTALRLSEDRCAQLQVRHYRNPLGRLVAWLRGRAWRAPELRRARLLFHLERHHVPAPRLLAFGQRCRGTKAAAFVLSEMIQIEMPPLATMLRETAAAVPSLLDDLAGIIQRLHEAGCAANSLEAFAVADGTIVVANPGRLSFRKRMSQRQRRIDIRRLCRSITTCCGTAAAEQFREALARFRG
jgi:tRNA A-37 threonylcarbamoyl transferase component Bud32